MRLLIIISLVLLISCTQTTNTNENKAYRLKPIWSTTEGLVGCESILYDSINECIYVSNSLEYDFTGKGYITKFNLSGELIDSGWVTGLNRPTGMALKGDYLYVGDIDHLVKVKISTAKIAGSYKVESSILPGINDVSINKKGEVYVSASNLHAVFKLQEDSLNIWAQDTILLKWANGIIALDSVVMVAGDKLTMLPYSKPVPELFSGSLTINDFDGLKSDQSGGYFLSAAGANKLWHLDAGGRHTVIYEGETYFADFEYIPEKSQVIIPSGNHNSKQYSISLYSITKH